MNFLLPQNKKIYFASDLHLMQAPDTASHRREMDFIRWLDTVKNDAEAIFLLGDIFDFWFEYRRAVPRGFVRLLGKLGELTDGGIPIHFFTGNHDLWIRDYLPTETGMIIHRHPEEFTANDKSFLVGHGHHLGTVSLRDKLSALVFNSKILRKAFSAVHPDWGIAFGQRWSENSRKRHGLAESFESPDKEEIMTYAYEKLVHKHYDFFVFGHRHLAMDVRLSESSRYINTGEWMEGYTYAIFDGQDVSLHSFKGKTRFLTV